MFTCWACFSRVSGKMFIKLPYFHETSRALRNLCLFASGIILFAKDSILNVWLCFEYISVSITAQWFVQWPYAKYYTDCIKYIQNSVYSVIYGHIQAYAALLRHIYTYWSIIKAYSAPCVFLTYPQPYQALAYIEPEVYSKPCETGT